MTMAASMSESVSATDGRDTATVEAATDQPSQDAEPSAGISRRHLISIDALIAIATVLAVVGMVSVWANRLLFNPDNWESTSTQLLGNSEIRNATSNYLIDQLYANVNVAGVLKGDLPPLLKPLAGPAAGALRNVAAQGVNLALSRPRVQTLWAKANRAADQTFIAIVNGGKGPVGVKSGAVTLNLSQIVDQVATQLGLPSSIAAKLPPDIGHLTVFRSNQIKVVQNVGNAVRGLALWLTILVPVLYGLAILFAGSHRRRTLMTVGFAIVFAGVIGVAGRSILESKLTSSLVSDETLRPAVRATIAIGTSILGDIAGAFILVGIVVVIAAWFAGPAKIATLSRRAIAPFLREQPVWSFTIVAAVMILIFIWQPIHAAGTPAGIVAFMALALLGTEALRRQTETEFPDARPGDAKAALSARWRSLRGRPREQGPTPPSPGSLPEQLERLAALRDEGAITAEEYDAAKANVLHA